MDTNETKTLNEIIRSEFDFSSFSPKEQEKMIEDSTQMITEMALMKTIAEAPEEAKAGFDVFMDTNPSPEDMLQYLRINMPHFSQMLIQEIEIFKNTTASDAETIQKA